MSSSSSNSSTVSPAISDYAARLKSFYENALILDDSKWPLTPSKKFIRLELTEHCDRSNESIDKIMTGDIKGILEDRQEISIEEVLELKDDDKFQLVLVEGAPGIGKSTLSWELCRNWETFACMTQYKLVVLLRLRDREVQNITDIAGLFDDEQDVAKEIKKVLGKGVLFILDGFNELPLPLQQEGFLIKKLICGKALPKSRVLVTTRPSATATLLTSCHAFLKKRIDVQGFTLKRVEEYAESVFQDSKMLSKFRTYILSAKNPAINTLMYVPLNAAIVVALYKHRLPDSGPMPSTMTELYIELCLTLLKRYLDRPGQPEVSLVNFQSLPEDQYLKFLELCKIAYEVQTSDLRNLDPSLEHFGFLDAVPSLRGGGKISYNFLHQTVKEFLAAYHISLLSEDKRNIAEQQKNGEDWNMVMRFVAGLTRSVPQFDPSHLTPELILCLYEAQCTADYASLFGGECRLKGWITQPLQAYALGYCIANSKASWMHIDIFGGMALDSFGWGVRSTKSPCGGVVKGMEVIVGEDDQLDANHFKDAPLSGLSYLTCSADDSAILDNISQAIPVMTGLEELTIQNSADNLRLSNLLLQLVFSNVQRLSLPGVIVEESLQEYCSALSKLLDPSSSGKLVELKLDISYIAASKLLDVIFSPSSLQTISLYFIDIVTNFDLPATCTNTNILVSTLTFAGVIPAHVVVDLMERNRALQALIINSDKNYYKYSFLHYCYDVINGIPESSSLERVFIHNRRNFRSLKIEYREDLRECANTLSVGSFIELVTERGLFK